MDMNSPVFRKYYSRHIKIDSYGRKNQEKVSASSCLIIGMGGLGCPAALYLAVSGVGRLGLCDYDEIEVSNLARQVLYSASDTGRKKAVTAQKILQDKNPLIEVEVHDTLLNESNAKDILSKYDMVLDCTDNFHSKYLIHDTAFLLRKNLVQGSVFQTHGQVASFPFGREDFRGCMRCLWPTEPEAASVKPCADAGVLSVVAGTVGLRQATCALQLLTGGRGQAGQISLYRYSSQSWEVLPLPILEDCPCCSTTEQDSIRTRTPLEIACMPDGQCEVVDVRNEMDQTAFPDKFHVYNASDREIMNVPLLAQNLDKQKHNVLICYRGMRSLDICAALRAEGFERVYSYAGGYMRFMKNESDPADPV